MVKDEISESKRMKLMWRRLKWQNRILKLKGKDTAKVSLICPWCFKETTQHKFDAERREKDDIYLRHTCNRCGRPFVVTTTLKYKIKEIFKPE